MSEKLNKGQVPVVSKALWYRNERKLSCSLEEYFRCFSVSDNERIYLYLFRPSKAIIDLNELEMLNKFLHTVPLTEKGKNKLPVFIDLNNICFSDKLVYVIFESLIFYLINDCGWMISIVGDVNIENCSNAVVHSSLFFGNCPISVLGRTAYEDIFLEKNKRRIEKYKYNRVEKDDLSFTRYFVKPTDKSTDSNYISSDILDFLENSNVLNDLSDSFIEEIANTIIEIKDNCAEHTDSPYFYDIDVKKVIHGEKSKRKGQEYIAVNVAIWDFSERFIGDAVKNKVKLLESPISSDEYRRLVGGKERSYKKLLEAKLNHDAFYDEKYTEDDFFSLAVFQPGITGREEPETTGGAGLSSVLDFLCKFSDDFRYYCLTGCSVINLSKKMLNKDHENWYSFNESKTDSFIESKPSGNCINKSKLYFPGTAHFLHLEINGGFDDVCKQSTN